MVRRAASSPPADLTWRVSGKRVTDDLVQRIADDLHVPVAGVSVGDQ